MQIRENKIDPRTKLTAVIIISSLAVFIRDITLLLGILLITFTITYALGNNPLMLVKKLKKLIWVFIAIIVIQSVFSSGTPIIRVANVTIFTVEGITKGLQLGLRMCIIVISASIVSTSSPREIVQGLIQWKIPYEIAFMVSIAIRFLPLFIEEIKDTVTAIQLRGIELDRIPIRKRIKIYSYVLMPVVASTLMKSKQLSVAMESKGFGIYPTRASFKKLKMVKADYLIIAVFLLGAFAIIKVYLY
ncbi:energy-coupling factor transporter transmembrane component T family protein [Alkaliphilus peptidifermentans]|uniref:Energy-coupling factor transport system permease protein n=1 Tax=Alkaliphilus peptidifermentans DSM 18978 TaxID=1120976 RepID=A0A1G5GKL7_9FIRM|nr:energy-coupling factor transporter transmembrane component T [Alkaliphilus peptidifermentans]SCY52063.1 energy-coupling factor transport system permease protein [Alkaliphilus peptidifermentans DSM 18978]